MALTQKRDNINWSLIFERLKTVEEKEGQEKGEKKRKRKRKRREEKERKIKGMELVYICMDTCLWVVGCEKPNSKMNSCMEIFTNPFDLSRVLLGFHHNLRFLEIRVGKTPYGTR